MSEAIQVGEVIEVGAHVASATASAVAFDWGLKGWSKVVASFGAIGVICMMMIYQTYQVGNMHEQAIATLERLHAQERESNREVHDRMAKVVEKNTAAIDKLADEFRRHRMENRK